IPAGSISDVVALGGNAGALKTAIAGPSPLPTDTPDTGVRPPPPPEATGPEQSPVPFPEPRGEQVDAKVAGLPLYPGAVEVDGWIVREGDFEKAVQQYATDAKPAEVIDYYKAELAKQGYSMTGNGYGVQGE